MRTNRTISLLASVSLLSAGGMIAGGAEEAKEQIIMKNDHWELKIEPRWGGRASSMRSLSDNYDFVSCWGEVKQEKHGTTREGGILRSMMSGSCNSSQPEEPYTVVKSSEKEVLLTYNNPHPLLDGLREEKKITLDGRQVVFSVKVTNVGKEPRLIYYRIQDWPGVGLRQGKDSVYIIPKGKDMPFAFVAQPCESINRHFLNPSENWYALADLVNNRGLLVSLNKTPAADIYFWASGSKSAQRTAEIFFPQAKLLPNQSWEMEARYTAFLPSEPKTGDSRLDGILSKEKIENYLVVVDQKTMRGGLPFNAEMELPWRAQALTITPMHPADRALGNRFAPDYEKTLKKIYLYGTPGEVVSFAVAVTADKDIKTGKVTFGDLKDEGRNTIASKSIEPKYVAGESLILVNGWDLSKNIPTDVIGGINNDVKDPDSLTPFSLQNGETAWVWSNLRVPENTPAGKYLGMCDIKVDGNNSSEFEISLTVRPFKLIKAEHKTYGTFFDYHIKPREGEAKGRNAPYMITREEYLKVLKVVADVGYNGLLIYVTQDDILWVLDRCAELGMKGDYVLMYSWYVKPEDIKARNMTAYGWTVDEPGWYWEIPEAIKRYKNVLGNGWTPTFTPHLPLGLIMADLLDKMVPIINPNGNAPYLMAATKRYKKEGRKVYWYECYGLGVPSVEQRALRGIYLWKEPVDGIYDWDDSSNRPKLSAHHMAGFAGTKVLPRLGMENTRQALTDLNYLHTLETLAKETKDSKLRAEAGRLMDWIKKRFDSDYRSVIPYIADPRYLDDIRQSVADMIEKLTL